MQRNRAARQLMLQESFGVLSTISVDVEGYPFGSVAPYCADAQCRPVIYVSRIAQHTRNILADSRVSLTVLENPRNSEDVQAQGRLTLIARAAPVAPGDSATSERYFRYFPSARQYDRTHDFAFFRLEPVRVRFIGGFGQIYWLEADDFMATNPFSPAQESRIIEHMNKDHGSALEQFAGGTPAVMAGIDSEGFDLLTGNHKARFVFDIPVRTMEDARHALAERARRPA